MIKITRIDPPELYPLTFRVNQVLRSNPYLSGSNILFSANAGVVTLRGTARTFYQKQVAQEALRGVDGVLTIENQIEVPQSKN